MKLLMILFGALIVSSIYASEKYYYIVEDGGRIPNLKIFGQAPQLKSHFIKENPSHFTPQGESLWVKSGVKISVPQEIVEDLKLKKEISIRPDGRIVKYEEDIGRIPASTNLPPVHIEVKKESTAEVIQEEESSINSQFIFSAGFSFFALEGLQLTNGSKAFYVADQTTNLMLGWRQIYNDEWSSLVFFEHKEFTLQPLDEIKLSQRHQSLRNFGMSFEKDINPYTIGFGLNAEEKLLYRMRDLNVFVFEKRYLLKPNLNLSYLLYGQEPFSVSAFGVLGVNLPQDWITYKFKQGKSYKVGLNIEQRRKKKMWGANIFYARDEYPIRELDLTTSEMGLNLYFAFD